MIQVILESFKEAYTGTQITIGVITFRIVFSILLGLLVGLERQYRKNSAGIRTFSLISMGSCLAMILSIWLSQIYPGSDPGRIAAQAFTGIGFLGAGVIIRYRENTKGLTTAACIWVVASVGLAVGAGLIFASLLVTIITIITLFSLYRFEVSRHIDGNNKSLEIRASNLTLSMDRVKSIFENQRVIVMDYSIHRDMQNCTTVLDIKVFLSSRNDRQQLLQALEQIEDVTSISLNV